MLYILSELVMTSVKVAVGDAEELDLVLFQRR